jgi:hypothetical protein
MKKFSLAGKMTMGAALFAAVGGAHAALVQFSYGTPQTATVMAGTGPWLDVNIADQGTSGTLTLTVTSHFTGTQTLTGLWFNVDPTVASGIASFSFGPTTLSGGGIAPTDFAAAASPSAFTATASQNPSGVGPAVVGSYDLLIRFANFQQNSAASTATAIFNLTAAGAGASAFTANSFVPSAPSAAGRPTFFSVASFTNAGGSGGTGNAFLTPSAVPLPAGQWLMLPGLAALGWVASRRSYGLRRQDQA